MNHSIVTDYGVVILKKTTIRKLNKTHPGWNKISLDKIYRKKSDKDLQKFRRKLQVVIAFLDELEWENGGQLRKF